MKKMKDFLFLNLSTNTAIVPFLTLKMVQKQQKNKQIDNAKLQQTRFGDLKERYSK